MKSKLFCDASPSNVARVVSVSANTAKPAQPEHRKHAVFQQLTDDPYDTLRATGIVTLQRYLSRGGDDTYRGGVAIRIAPRGCLYSLNWCDSGGYTFCVSLHNGHISAIKFS